MLYFNVLANTGDSRAVLFQYKEPTIKIRENSTDSEEDTKSPWTLVSLFSTTDHSLDLHKEKQRIIQQGGRVERYNGNIGPLRVWLKDEDKPGLAMSRSIGDHQARSVGVICEPDIEI